MSCIQNTILKSITFILFTRVLCPIFKNTRFRNIIYLCRGLYVYFEFSIDGSEYVLAVVIIEWRWETCHASESQLLYVRIVQNFTVNRSIPQLLYCNFRLHFKFYLIFYFNRGCVFIKVLRPIFWTSRQLLFWFDLNNVTSLFHFYASCCFGSI